MDITTICMLFGLTPEQTAMIAAVLGVLFALSEALALIPSVKSNSVFQLIYNGLKKLGKKGAAMIALFCLVVGLSSGCSGVQTVAPYEIGKEAAVTILYEARLMNNSGKLSDEDFAKVKRAYDSLAAAQNLAIDFRITYLQSKDPADKIQYEAYLRNVPLLLKDLMELATSFGVNIGGVQ